MKKLFSILMIGTFFCSGALSQATTLTFEDLPGTGPVPSNYAGLTWTNWVATADFCRPGTLVPAQSAFFLRV